LADTPGGDLLGRVDSGVFTTLGLADRLQHVVGEGLHFCVQLGFRHRGAASSVDD
jgi:hypothetical protein